MIGHFVITLSFIRVISIFSSPLATVASNDVVCVCDLGPRIRHKLKHVIQYYRVGTKFGNERFVVYPENQWSNLLQIFFTN